MSDYPGVWPGTFEVRARGGGGRVLTGSFPYGKTATVRASGRTRKERFAPDSLSWQVREFEKVQAELGRVLKTTMESAEKELLVEGLEDALERRNTHLLVGHNYGHAIADMRTGNLAVRHTRASVEIEATLPAADRMPSWIRDAVLAVEGGQLRGISPGFRVPAGKGGERLVPEEGPGGSMVREITDAVAFEYSLVARPAYASTAVDARADDPAAAILTPRRRVWL